MGMRGLRNRELEDWAGGVVGSQQRREDAGQCWRKVASEWQRHERSGSPGLSSVPTRAEIVSVVVAGFAAACNAVSGSDGFAGPEREDDADLG
ncbi:hypothetical protein M0R45_016479 [Rubus argutus]|uniref:Uncharacterized protein n=1 Tax=Rubus argutus TaxID=59490 RepID=A0AAW1XV58_RUBAR